MAKCFIAKQEKNEITEKCNKLLTKIDEKLIVINTQGCNEIQKTICT